MTQSTVTKLPLTNPSRTGSANRAGNADETGFAASMTAVVTVNVSKDDKEAKGGSTTSTTQGKTNDKTAEDTEGDVEIEIEITTLEGDDLAENLSVTSSRGSAEISVTADGEIGVSTDGIFYSDNPEVQMGETLTFTVPEELGDVQGATITVSNLVDDKTGAESALVIAYDAEGKEVLRCVVEGNKSGDVTVDIDVSFSKIDFKPVDNGSWTLSGNSDFTIERIAIKTGVADQQEPVQQGKSGFLSDYLSLFEQRNFKLQRSVNQRLNQSFTDIFATGRSADFRQADDAARRGIDEQSKSAKRMAEDRN